MLKPIIWELLTSEEQRRILKRPMFKSKKDLIKKVKLIIQRVRQDKDVACIQLTKEIDDIDIDYLAVSDEEFASAYQQINDTTLQAMKRVITQLHAFHLPQKLTSYQVETVPGVLCESQIRPLQQVGIYVPGGTAPLVSTVLMIGVPSNIANCPIRVLCTPPDKKGQINPNILVAAELCGIKKIYKLGGAQAIAAMAYGTETIPKVDKIFGPGNHWVTEAKIQVSLDADGASCDLPAGPSEVMIIADNSACAEFVAADLLSQAEHGIDSQVILLCLDIKFASKVGFEIEKKLSHLSRRHIAAQALLNGRLIVVNTIDQAIVIANTYAPEHLILQVDKARNYVTKIYCAGSVFLGPWSPESVGDYASGTNHVLPTNGFAKSLSGLSVRDFIKTISIQELTKDGLCNIADTIKELATIEGLDAHKKAVEIRLGEVINAK